MTNSTSGYWKDFRLRPAVLVCSLILLALLGTTYWTPIAKLATTWWKSEDYQHGFFVVPFCIFLLWWRRELMPAWPQRGTRWGLAPLAAWAALRWTAAYFYFGTLDHWSLVFFAGGVTLLLGGWPTLRWQWPSVLFLVFMVPLPGFAAELLTSNLQMIATACSTYVVQTLGIPATNVGTQIYLHGHENPMNVAETCSGLRMLMLFFAICVGTVFVVRPPLWLDAAILISAVPIAILANVIRITLTAILHHLQFGDLADKFFHDFSGLAMMPVGILLLWGEVSLLRKIVVEEDTSAILASVGRLDSGR